MSATSPPDDVDVYSLKQADQLAGGVPRAPSRPAAVTQDHLGRERLLDVPRQRRSHGPSSQAYELAAQLVRQRGICAQQRPVLLRKPGRTNRDHGEGGVLGASVLGGLADALLETWPHGKAQNDTAPDLRGLVPVHAAQVL